MLQPTEKVCLLLLNLSNETSTTVLVLLQVQLNTITTNMNEKLEKSMEPEGEFLLLDIKLYLQKFVWNKSIIIRIILMKIHIKSIS